jgi:hypothetical protein
MRLHMGLVKGLLEWAAGTAGLIGVFVLLLFIGSGIFVVGSFMVLIPGFLIEVFTHDKNFKLVPWRVALVIGVVVGLFMVRWYLPFAIAAAIGLIGMLIELMGTSW